MNKLLREWNEANLQLKKWKTRELELRNKVITAYPGDQGTTHTSGKDFKLTIVRGVTRSIDTDVLTEITDQLSPEEEACLKYEVKLDVRKYDQIDSKLLSRAIIVKPSQPTVKLEIFDDAESEINEE